MRSARCEVSEVRSAKALELVKKYDVKRRTRRIRRKTQGHFSLRVPRFLRCRDLFTGSLAERAPCARCVRLQTSDFRLQTSDSSPSVCVRQPANAGGTVEWP